MELKEVRLPEDFLETLPEGIKCIFMTYPHGQIKQSAKSTISARRSMIFLRGFNKTWQKIISI